jgi:short-subunit dehydrogenase
MVNQKTVVITGASSGAGKAIALEFSSGAYKLVLAARNMVALEETAEECRALGAEVKCVQTDVTEPTALINLASEADSFGGKIDVWVNNAGILAVGAFTETPLEVTEQVVRTNLLGYIYGAHAVMPYFKKQGHGTLINNISIGGFMPVPYGVGYSASKFGIRGFSSALKAELSDFPGIHVCDAYPAFLDSPGIQHAANYTGKALKPAPPVYDPRRLAMAIVSLADNPRSELMVGSVSSLLRFAYGIFPGITTTVTKAVISTYLNQAKDSSKTNGNIFNTLAFGNAVFGGWGLPGRPKAHRKYLAAGLIITSALSFMLLRKPR